MFLYENDRCPVCQKGFEKGDDIVTCPECGTPHHRECYKEIGGCENRSLHGTDFVYKRGDSAGAQRAGSVQTRSPFLAELPYSEEAQPSEYYVPKNTEEFENPNEHTETVGAAPEITDAGKDIDEIDGVNADDIVSVVSVNAVKFLPKFRRNKRINWNWSAFFFGPFYFFFRKMHIQGAVFTALEYGIRFIISAAFLSSSIAFESAMAEVKTMTDYYAAFASFMADPEYQNFMTANMLILAALLLIHIFCALLADSFYRKKVVDTVKSVDEKVNMGESFSIMGPMAAMESSMSQQDMRKIFLSRQGGVSTMAPLLAIIIIQLLLNMLSIL